MSIVGGHRNGHARTNRHRKAALLRAQVGRWAADVSASPTHQRRRQHIPSRRSGEPSSRPASPPRARSRRRARRGSASSVRGRTSSARSEDVRRRLAFFAQVDPILGPSSLGAAVRIIARRTLRESWKLRATKIPRRLCRRGSRRHRTRTGPRRQTSNDNTRSASFVGNSRVVFNIGGNKCRLVVAIKYTSRMLFIRFVGGHAQYDRIDAEAV